MSWISVNYTKIIENVLNKSNKLIINSYNYQRQKELGKGAFGDNQYQIDIVAEEAISSFIREYIPNCSIILVPGARGILDPETFHKFVLEDARTSA